MPTTRSAARSIGAAGSTSRPRSVDRDAGFDPEEAQRAGRNGDASRRVLDDARGRIEAPDERGSPNLAMLVEGIEAFEKPRLVDVLGQLGELGSNRRCCLDLEMHDDLGPERFRFL